MDIADLLQYAVLSLHLRTLLQSIEWGYSNTVCGSQIIQENNFYLCIKAEEEATDGHARPGHVL